MGYTPEHTARTRRRILDAAARLFRRHGFQGVGIDEIMAEAGLTRGGFYAHFRSKEDLLVRVLAEELEFATRLRDARQANGAKGRQAALERVAYYLEPDNLRRIGSACTMAANVSDLGRASYQARRGFTRAFDALIDEFREIVAPRCRDRESRALAAVATCAGAIALARAVTDRQLTDEILTASKRSVLRTLGYTTPTASRSAAEAPTGRR